MKMRPGGGRVLVEPVRRPAAETGRYGPYRCPPKEDQRLC